MLHWQHKKGADGSVFCCLPQQDCAAALIREMGCSSTTKSSLMTHFWSGPPVHALPHIDTPPAEHAPLTFKMQSCMDMINWLQQCTHLDLANIFCLLAS